VNNQPWKSVATASGLGRWSFPALVDGWDPVCYLSTFSMCPPITEGIHMAVARVTEISAGSSKSFDDAIKSGIARANKTLENVRGAWVSGMKVKCDRGKVTEYRVRLKVSFVLKN
jgi:dodecin